MNFIKKLFMKNAPKPDPIQEMQTALSGLNSALRNLKSAKAEIMKERIVIEQRMSALEQAENQATTVISNLSTLLGEEV